MKDDESATGGLSRRGFIKGGLYAAAALSVPLIVNTSSKSMAGVTNSSYSSDVLVIGSGFAGTFAALEARKQGLTVTMVDKCNVGWSGMSPWASDRG